MQTQSIAKACVIPVCNNQKFNLVHKFPADNERFVDWLNAIQSKKPIDKLSGLTPEAIRKRFFICSRHFGLNEYKNIESRSLNLTAVPNLNLESLDKMFLSKAFQLEKKVETNDEHPEPTEIVKPNVNPSVKPFTPVRILNSAAPKTTQMCVQGDKFPLVSSKPVKKPRTTTIITKEEETAASSEPLIKRFKKSSESWLQDKLSAADSSIEITTEAYVACETDKSPTELSSEKFPTSQKLLPPAVVTDQSLIKSSIENLTEAKPANKLLALIEVTPEQYEKLNCSLSTAERNENVTSLINFMNENNDTATADNGNYFLINLT